MRSKPRLARTTKSRSGTARSTVLWVTAGELCVDIEDLSQFKCRSKREAHQLQISIPHRPDLTELTFDFSVVIGDVDYTLAYPINWMDIHREATTDNWRETNQVVKHQDVVSGAYDDE